MSLLVFLDEFAAVHEQVWCAGFDFSGFVVEFSDVVQVEVAGSEVEHVPGVGVVDLHLEGADRVYVRWSGERGVKDVCLVVEDSKDFHFPIPILDLEFER